MTRNTLFVATAASLLFAGCEKQAPAPAAPAGAAPAGAPKAPAIPATPAHSPAAAPAPAAAPGASATGPIVSAMNLTFKLPEGWKQAPPSNSMRLAEATVADPSGDAAKACVVAFSSAGGDVQSNIGRWANQMQDASGQPLKPDSKQKTVAGLPVHTVEFAGTYLGMGDGQPKSDWMLRAAIVETPDGLLFIKMNGPAERLKTMGAAFDSMVDSMAKAK